jgi:prolipoprotein diacylglyceryltransferase
MIGGGAEDPSQFNGNELFSSTRITLSPLLIVVGYVIIFYAIMKRPKKDNTSDKEA